MLETPHVVVGAAIAIKVANPLLALPLAFGSHFVLEKIPHWNPHLNTEYKKYKKVTKKSTLIVVADSLTALTIGSSLALLSYPDIKMVITILLSCLFAILPDLIEAPYFFLHQKSKFIDKWIKFQKSLQVDTEVIPGLFTQIITVITALLWIFL